MTGIAFVNIHGQSLSVDALAKMHKRTKAATEAPDKFHKGWKVEGHPPGAMEAAHAKRQADLSRWGGATDADRASWRRTGEREPKPWDESLWRANTRLKAVRTKPYEIESSAKQCAAMATASGWLDVRVVELRKGNA